MESAAAGTYLRVYETGVGYVEVRLADERKIIPAMTENARDPQTDAVLILTTACGMEYRVRASRIQSYQVSTPASRLQQMQWRKGQMEEYDSFRERVGMPLVREDPYPWEL